MEHGYKDLFNLPISMNNIIYLIYLYHKSTKYTLDF